MNWIAGIIHRLWLKIGKRLKASFYLYLAIIFTLVVFAQPGDRQGQQARTKSYLYLFNGREDQLVINKVNAFLFS
jgi:hypothetical protein